jgi:VWFA-related protein
MPLARPYVRSLTALLVLTPLLTLAQTPEPHAVPAPPPAPLVLDVTVTTKAGVAVPNLKPSNFTVLDDKLPAPILAFHPVDASREPLYVIIVLDAVNTGYQEVSYERIQLAKFLSSTDGHLAYPTSLAILTDKGIELEPNFTQDGNSIRSALENEVVGLRTINRSTGFYGATDRLDISLNGLSELATHITSVPGRKLVLFLSPGWPILSGPDVTLSTKQQQGIFQQSLRFTNLLHTSRITLYAIDPYGAAENLERAFYYQSFLNGLRKPSDAALGNLSLQVLAEQSGGLVLNSTGISQLLDRCIAENSTYYRIAIARPAATHPDDYKPIQIKLSDLNLTARTSSGVYVQP